MLGIRLLALGALSAALACSSGGDGEIEPYAGYQSETYESLDPWLCHPDQDQADNRARPPGIHAVDWNAASNRSGGWPDGAHRLASPPSPGQCDGPV